jgi:hypothetical protein
MKKGVFRYFSIVIIACLASNVSFAQCKTFQLSDKGDTLNCVDMNGKKQGKWLIKVPELRGTPGYEEEGEFVDDRKEGIWRTFSAEGDVQAVQTYKWGLLNGKSQYFSLQGLEREESWWAIDPGKQYDTIEVPDLYQPDVTRMVAVKNEGHSMKHGKWKWFDPMTGFTTKTEDYYRDSAVNTLAVFGVPASNSRYKRLPKDTSAKKNEKPLVIEQWEKKNAGKKKVKYQDGSTGY